MNPSKRKAHPSADNTRHIPLTQGQSTRVNANNYKRFAKWKWYAQWNPKTRSFYAARTAPTVDGKCAGTIWMHREVLGLKRGDKRQGDHINSGDTLDNRRSNLRIASGFQNQHNRRKLRIGQSALKGVTRAHKKWKAEIKHNGKWYYLGVHETPELAHEAYCAAAEKLNGEFAHG